MPRTILDAQDIHPGSWGWTCTVQVVERHPIQLKELTTYPFQRRYRNYLLTDMKGTKIKAVMFDNDVDFFERSLQPFHRYKVSNANVTLPQEKYQLPGYKYSWIITTKTPVEPIIDNNPYPLPCSFDVPKFSELHKFAESDETVAIKALVVHRFPVIDITNTKSAKDYVVIDEEGIPMVLRLWKNLLADYDPEINAPNNDPVTIIASNIEVNTFHGLSLATKHNTYLIQNPPLAQGLDLRNWYAANRATVVALIQSKAYENNARFFQQPKQDQILSVTAAIDAFQNVKTCWIKGKIHLSVTRAPLYYVVCANCQMVVDADIDWDVQCSGCTVLSPMEVKLKLPITLRDENNEIKSMLKSPDADRLCPYTAVQVREHEIQGRSLLNELSIAMDNTEVVSFVKYYIKRGEATRRYVVLKTYTAAETKPLEDIDDPSLPQSDAAPTPAPAAAAIHVDSTPLSPARKSADTTEVQFFTPTYKNALEQVAKEYNRPESSTSPTPAAKRSITFGTLTAEDLAGIPSSETTASLSAENETPKKKTKGEEQNNQ